MPDLWLSSLVWLQTSKINKAACGKSVEFINNASGFIIRLLSQASGGEGVDSQSKAFLRRDAFLADGIYRENYVQI